MVLPKWLTGFFVAVMMGAVLTTFNSALNSAATVFSLGIYKRYIRRDASERSLVRIGKWSSFLLAVFAISVAPFVGDAPEGLYQLLQQLNGIFFIPIASVITAGFLFPRVTSRGALAGLLFGFAFYVVTNFVLEADVHFVHLWGIEFVLNIALMHAVSALGPAGPAFEMQDSGKVDLKPWKHTRAFSVFLVAFTILLYFLLGNV